MIFSLMVSTFLGLQLFVKDNSKIELGFELLGFMVKVIDKPLNCLS